MTDAERKVIIKALPNGFHWDKVNYTPMGNFAQLLYDDNLIGYVMLDDGEPYFKGKGLWKG